MSNSKGIFRELIDYFTAELDKTLKDHIESALGYKGLSKTIQNEFLDAMLRVYHQQVGNEMKKTDYVAVIADETTDVSNQFQLVLVFRYIVDGRPVERFWKFLLPSGHDSNGISACILNEISLLVDDPEKLIAQSYDGAAVMSGAINGVHKHVQERYPRANFVHCYAHQANLIMSHATSSNSDCRIIFANLTGLCTLFSTSPQRAARLEEFLHKKGLPSSSKIKRNFNSSTVNAVYEHREEIIGALEKIEREATFQITIQQAGAHLRILEAESFIYWLTFFHKIMPHVDILFNQLQKVTTDALKIHNNIGDFERAIGKIRSEIGNTETQPVDQNNSELTPPPSKRRRTADKSERRKQSIEVCDSILLEIKTRFQFIGHLILSKLVSFNQFPLFEKEFPEDFLKEAIKFYPCLNGGRLRTELSVLYAREEFRQSSETNAVGLLGLLQDGLSNSFHEVIKLLKIIITIPMTTSEAERQFSRLKRIKTFLRNTMKEDRLNALTMLSCEKEFINDFPNFNEKVIELFCTLKTRKMDFIYRQL
ncbi:unnamed protein product [Callosobruchus maculatus]|uniref:HAT C-terminal dimerisation domain-containing protein n=1 Tax=Callosobruchus maculatus TaxID=64391 RepID=A0A653DMX9_CALMS|nr:unnamed protein product [Callosobruchus maculatus]